MTRKDYIAIAAAIAKVRASYAPHWDPNLFRALDDATTALASHCAADNALFDNAKFLKACGYGTKAAA